MYIAIYTKVGTMKNVFRSLSGAFSITALVSHSGNLEYQSIRLREELPQFSRSAIAPIYGLTCHVVSLILFLTFN